ncbi:hypothetical protein [Ligilactobacillus pobuzihii]|uniref:hypothetical protein n=1 Tax=Ligilactobacillus pobuzihii TaxID=449659 RepID=UPI000370F077|nr:hypothetical protein [Ligilactobacillus pobuzihii]GEN48914.1 hypothetical protein LPO01_17060 [Ligilactobacillus pobuzihii]
MSVIDILLVFLVMVLLVSLDQLESDWEERRYQREHSNDNSGNSVKHYGGGRHFERNNRAD